MPSTLVLLQLRCLLACLIWGAAVQIKIDTPKTTFASIFEIPAAEKLGSGDLSPLLEGLYEEQVKYQDSMNPGELTISRRILVNMRHFLAKFMQPREALLWEMIMKDCQNDYERPQFVHMSWRLFWNSLRKVNVQKDWNEWNPYWRPEVPSPFKNKSGNVVLPDIEWNKKIFLLTKNHTIRDWHTLVVFNLYFCEKPHLRHSYLCPDGCFGRRNLYDQHRELGNPCENATNTRTPRCITKQEAWPDIIKRMWTQLENPEEALDGDFISGSFSWLTKNQGYECDCKADFVWNPEEMICERDESHQKHCDPVTLKPCQLPGAKSCRMNDITGEALCTCHPQYTGNFCERLRDPCLERTINVTLSDGRQLIQVSGQTMCQVNMNGLPTDPEYREVKVDAPSKGELSHVEAVTLPLHSRCVGKLGTDSYFCQCEKPFVEDISLPLSNCLLQVGSCDSKLCIHGACVTTANQRGMAVCVCYAGYTGPQCNQKEEEWSVWTSCKPTCGRFRSRSRTRLTYSEEENGLTETIRQVETCPPRLGKDCPITILLEENYTNARVEEEPFSFVSLFDASNPDVMKLQTFAATCAVLLIAFIQLLRCVTFMLVL